MMKIGPLFSDFGYRALDLLFNMDTSQLPPPTIQKLAVLAYSIEQNPRLLDKLRAITGEQDDREDDRLQKLLSLAETLDK